MSQPSPYVVPRLVSDPSGCEFYHSMDIPGHGFVEGEWDLRDDVDPYLGHTDFSGKRVIEMGTASGFLCFEMERRGAEVVAVDVSDELMVDIVPYAKLDAQALEVAARQGIRRINDAYWFAHRAHGSNARVARGTVYDVPTEIGAADIVTYGSILEHLRDPFRALQVGSRFARETIIVTNVISRRHLPLVWLNRLGIAGQAFVPNARRGDGVLYWWILTPLWVRRVLGVLGFADTRVGFHSAPYRGRRARLFTVVGRRTDGQALR